MSDPTASKSLVVQQLQAGMKNVNITVIVLEVGAPRRTPQGNDVRTIRVADPTGSINMSVWNELGEFVNPGDLFRIRNGCTAVHRGCLALSLQKTGEMLKIGEFFMAYSDQPDMSSYNADLEAKFPYRKGSPEEEKDEASSSSNGNGFAGGTHRPNNNSTGASTTQHFGGSRGGGSHHGLQPPNGSHQHARGHKRPMQHGNRPAPRVDAPPQSQTGMASRIY
jgi:hypothetical protein